MRNTRDKSLVGRSFAGYSLLKSLGTGLYGETFAGKNKAGENARVLVVDSRIARKPEVRRVFARFAQELGRLVHPHLVTTRKVGRGKDGGLVVIFSDVESPLSLETLMESDLSSAQALGIAMGLLRGLAFAHQNDLPHGALHPRSVLIDVHGIVKLGDFGIARTVVHVGSESGEGELLAGLRGYLAPELVLGDTPTICSDVYALGVMVSKLVGPIDDDAAHLSLSTLMDRAVHTDPEKRLASASELEEALRSLVAQHSLEVASPSELRSVLLEQSAGLERDTSDFLDTLGKEPPGQREAKLDEETVIEAGSDIEVSSDDEEEEGEWTTVDSEPENQEDPLASLIRSRSEPFEMPVSSGSTAQPRQRRRNATGKSAKGRIATKNTRREDYVDSDETPLPPPRPFHQDGTHAHELVDLVGKEAAESGALDDSRLLPIAKRSRTLRWVALLSFGAAILLAIAYTQTGLFNAAKENREEIHDHAMKRAMDLQPKSGQVVIRSEASDAAVWVLLGETPLRSLVLPASMSHELYLEKVGYKSSFVAVEGKDWTQSEGEFSASKTISLEPGEMDAVPPAFPPKRVPSARAKGGQGPLILASEPSSARVWLWIGTTPEAVLRGVEVGANLQFRVLKDGMHSAEVQVQHEDWFLSGIDGPTRTSIERVIALESSTAKPKKLRRRR